MRSQKLRYASAVAGTTFGVTPFSGALHELVPEAARDGYEACELVLA